MLLTELSNLDPRATTSITTADADRLASPAPGPAPDPEEARRRLAEFYGPRAAELARLSKFAPPAFPTQHAPRVTVSGRIIPGPAAS